MTKLSPPEKKIRSQNAYQEFKLRNKDGLKAIFRILTISGAFLAFSPNDIGTKNTKTHSYKDKIPVTPWI
jgi:hypothetical protein